jgi:hypothetical protein
MRITLDAEYGIYPVMLRYGLGVGRKKMAPPSPGRLAARRQAIEAAAIQAATR